MPEICVDQNFRVGVGGKLDVVSAGDSWAATTLTGIPGSDGDFTTEQPLWARIHVNEYTTLTNSSGASLKTRILLRRPSRYIRAAQPNLVLQREITDVAFSAPAAAPDVNNFFSEWGGGIARDNDPAGVPLAGVYGGYDSRSNALIGEVVVAPGETLYVTYVLLAYTPQPFSATANNNTPDYSSYGFGSLTQLIFNSVVSPDASAPSQILWGSNSG